MKLEASKYLVLANWKMNGSKAFLSAWLETAQAQEFKFHDKVGVGVAPSYVHIAQLKSQ